MVIAKMRFILFSILICLGVTGHAAENDWPMTPGSSYFPLYRVEKISDRVYTFREGFYRSVFLITGDGVIVMDPLSVSAGKRMLKEIELLTDEPVKYVIYSHSHWDHAAGGQPFKDKGAQFISQERCLENFKRRPNPAVVMPDITFRDSYRLELGETSVDMYYFGPSHDICLSLGVIGPENILFEVDVAPPAGGSAFPFNPTMADVYMYNMVPFFRSVENLIKEKRIKVLIGAHAHFQPQTLPMRQAQTQAMRGLPTGIMMDGTLGPPDSVTQRRIFWESANQAVAGEIEAGTPLDQIPARLSKQRALAELVSDYDETQAKILFTRLVQMFRTGQ